MRHAWIKSISAILVTVLFLGCPGMAMADDVLEYYDTPGIDGDTSSDGAVITVVLFATCLVVLGLIALKSDFDNVFAKHDPAGPTLNKDVPESRLSLVLDHPQFKSASGRTQNEPEQDLASVGLGLRVRF